MHTLEKLKAVTTIVTHENCSDGTASAILLHDVLPDAKIVFLQYGTPAHRDLEAVPGMLFCDFTPHESRVADFVAAGAIVLDHHKFAKPIVDAFGSDGTFADETLDPGVSGATLAFHYVWLLLKPPERQREERIHAERLAILAGVRDTWQNKSPLFRQACIQAEMLSFYPTTEWLREGIFTASRIAMWSERMRLGELLVEKHESDVKKAIERGYRFTTGKGTRVLAMNDVRVTSDAMETLQGEVDLVIGFRYECQGGDTPKIIYSTRSMGTFNCGAFAKHYGGGGHTNAAGFHQRYEPSLLWNEVNPYTTIGDLVSKYESL